MMMMIVVMKALNKERSSLHLTMIYLRSLPLTAVCNNFVTDNKDTAEHCLKQFVTMLLLVSVYTMLLQYCSIRSLFIDV